MQEPYELPQIIKLDCPRRNALSRFPTSELWRLGMEVTRQNEGPEAFHRGKKAEPGYMHGIQNAFAFIMKEIDAPLTADMLANIHDICIQPISEEHIEKSATSFRDEESAAYSIELIDRDPSRGYFSRQGFIELFNKINQHEKTKGNKDRFFLEISVIGEAPQLIDTDIDDPEEIYDSLVKNEELIVYFYSRREKATYIKERVQQYIDDFYRNVSTANDDEKKLDLIIMLVKDLEQLHPFPDANGRTISMIAFNKVLIEHDFSPVMLENPNRIDGMSSLELREEVSKGMSNFNDYSIGNLRKFIADLSANDFRSIGKLKEINNNISDNPLTAIAQISALYKEISQNKIPLKTKSHSFFGYIKDTTEKKLIMNFLKEFYEEKVDHTLSSESSKKTSEQAFKEIISKHDIIESNPKLQSDIQQKIKDSYQIIESDNRIGVGW